MTRGRGSATTGTSRSDTAASPSSTSRRKATSRCDRRAVGSSSRLMVRSITTRPAARTARRHVAGALGHRDDARGHRALGRGGRRTSGSSGCSPSRCGTASGRRFGWCATGSASSRSTTGSRRTGLLFGSELSAFRAYPDFEAEVNRDALPLLLRYNSIPAPHTIYRGRTR